MTILANHPGFQHIDHDIFMHLDHESLLSCQSVTQTWKEMLDNPRLWLRKCSQNGLPKYLHTSWKNLILKLEDKGLKECVTVYLIQMHKDAQQWKGVEDDFYDDESIEEYLLNSFQPPLHMAAKAGDLMIVQFIMEQVGYTNIFNRYGNTPIHEAAENGHLEVVKYLLDCNCIPNIQGNAKLTPLHLAAINGHAEIVKALTTCTPRYNATDMVDENHLTPIHYAARSGHTEVAKILADHYTPDPISQGRLLHHLTTPIHLAAQCGHNEIVKILIAYTDDIEMLDFEGMTPIEYAISNGHTSVEKTLRKAILFNSSLNMWTQL